MSLRTDDVPALGHTRRRSRIELPFAHLNLRFNPFGELDPATWAEVAVLDGLELPPAALVQVMGDEGRGKTTMLRAWQRRLPGSCYEYVPDGADRFETHPVPAAGLLLDEAQRVRPRLLRGLFARANRLVVATHADLSSYSARPLCTIRVPPLTQARLAAMLSRRIEAARRGPGPVPRLSSSAQQQLLARFGDDLRAVELQLYELFQRLERPDDVVQV